jgi:hypothetical protein
MFRDVILPILLAVIGIALGLYLDYLNKKYPHLLGGTTLRRQPPEPDQKKADDTATASKPEAHEQAAETKAGQPGGKSAGDCCSGNFACMGMEVVGADAYGTVYRCRACGRQYYIDNYMRKRSALDETEAQRLLGLIRDKPRDIHE